MDSDPLAANVAKPEGKKDEKVAAAATKTGTTKE
jgi:multidrug efflux system membrane fusion protein